ncbi:MAG: hypothetical protein GWN13_23420, partial [Phycisphaerae bacterium]|nr:hypothetical protein [candidate division Zixibacteria bacterium]NIX01134.1 hypothetical protein [Phycisphaerae bacterium]
LKSDGTIQVYDSCYYPVEVDDFDYYAIGSGMAYAMVDLYRGYGPKDAVKTAAKFDNDTDVPVRVLRL